MPDFEQMEREYRELAAKLAYAPFEGANISEEDRARVAWLSEQLVRLSAPDFSKLVPA